MSVTNTASAFRALLRQNLSAFTAKAFQEINPGSFFQPAGHIDAMAHKLEGVGAGDIRRLAIAVPPRHLKSICAAVAFPAWMLGRDPSLRFLVASYGNDLAVKHARDFRTVVQSAWYRATFPKFGELKRTAEADIVTRANGSRKAVSLGGAVTGFGADILMIDDLMKASDASSPIERQRVKDFYEQTLFSRLDDKQYGRIVVLGQRLHEDDILGHLLGKGNFEELTLRAIAEEDESFPIGNGRCFSRKRGQALFPARESLETLNNVIRLEIGNPAFAAQYQQNPTSVDSAYIRWERIQTYDEALPRHGYSKVVQSWDTAMKAGPNCDYSVGTTWGFAHGRWWLLDLVRVQLDYPELKSRVIGEAVRWDTDVIMIEHAGTGISLLYDLMAEVRSGRRQGGGAHWMPRAYHPKVDKETRLAAQTAKLEERVLFPREARWLPDLKREVLGFPRARYDDQVDSVSQFLDLFGNFEPTVGRRNVVRR